MNQSKYPLNPMLHKSFTTGQYRLYCSNRDNLLTVLEALEIKFRKRKDITYNQQWEVYEFVTDKKEYKDKLKELFYETNLCYVEPVEDWDEDSGFDYYDCYEFKKEEKSEVEDEAKIIS